jgi:hypothetical protein
MLPAAIISRCRRLMADYAAMPHAAIFATYCRRFAADAAITLFIIAIIAIDAIIILHYC